MLKTDQYTLFIDGYRGILVNDEDNEKPTYEELEEFVLWAGEFQPEALAICKKHKFVFDDLDDPWQKLAFALYSDLCEINSRSRQLFEDVCEEPTKKEKVAPTSSFHRAWRGSSPSEGTQALELVRNNFRLNRGRNNSWRLR